MENKTWSERQTIVFQENTKTFRAMPSNVWLATVRNNNLLFDSWDGLAIDFLTDSKKEEINKLYKGMLKNFKFSFVGRKSGAIGKRYVINKNIKAINEGEAINELYTEFELIGTLCINGKLRTFADKL